LEISRKFLFGVEVVSKGGVFMFVAIRSITEYGQAVYCVNPVETTTDLRKAFKWTSQKEAEAVLHESMHIYGLIAYPVEIVQTQAQAAVEKKQELQAV
jgi:hypothetical protein